MNWIQPLLVVAQIHVTSEAMSNLGHDRYEIRAAATKQLLTQIEKSSFVAGLVFYNGLNPSDLESQRRLLSVGRTYLQIGPLYDNWPSIFTLLCHEDALPWYEKAYRKHYSPFHVKDGQPIIGACDMPAAELATQLFAEYLLRGGMPKQAVLLLLGAESPSFPCPFDPGAEHSKHWPDIRIEPK